MKSLLLLSSAVALSVLSGCAGGPAIFPNADPNLRRSPTQFAADAAKRHPYKAAAPHVGDAPVRAQYDVTFGNLQLLNYGSDDINDVEIWLNQNWVIWLPKLEKGKEQVKVIPFQMIYDDSGNPFSTENGKNPITSVELYTGGKIYNVVSKMAD